jgi:ribosomal protein S6
MTILAPDVPEDELTPAIDTIASYITRFDGTINAFFRESPWGRRRLSYPIRYQSRDVRDGFYVLWYFEAEPEAIALIDREIRLNDLIIRHLTIALDKPFVPAPPAPVEAPADAASAPEGEAAAEAAPAAEATDVVAEDAPAAEAVAEEVEAGDDTPAAAEEAAAVEEVEAGDDTPAAAEEAAAVEEVEAPAAAVEEAVDVAADEAPAEDAEAETAK